MGRLVDSGVQLLDLAVAPDGTIAYLDEKFFVRIFRCPVCGSLAEVERLARPRPTAAERRGARAVRGGRGLAHFDGRQQPTLSASQNTPVDAAIVPPFGEGTGSRPRA